MAKDDVLFHQCCYICNTMRDYAFIRPGRVEWLEDICISKTKKQLVILPGETMISITVFPIMQGNDYPTAGELLYGIIMKDIDSEDRIVLDMEGVSLIPSMFLNTSLGRIIRERGVPFVKAKFGFTNIKASDANRIREYVGRFE